MLLGLRELMLRGGRAEPSARIDLGGLAEKIVSEVSGRADLAPVPPIEIVGTFGSIEGQPEKIGHVFRNLLENAVRHAHHCPDVRIEIGGRRHEGGELLCWVRDSGEGIPYAYQKVIFEPFRRVPGASGSGHGLGLALVRQIVAEHRGRVWVESEPGQGATFWMSFSLARSDGPDEQNRSGRLLKKEI